MFFSLTSMAQKADMLLTNGKVFTADTARLYVEAIAIRGNKIMAVGTTAEMQKLAGPGTRKIDLGGKTVIPGINDAHDHIGHGGSPAREIKIEADIYKGPGFRQLLDSIEQVAKATPKGTLLRATVGLSILEDPTARRSAIDMVAPDNPVILQSPWGHGTIVNSAALKMLGIGEGEKDPSGGYFERDQLGKLTGKIMEYAETNYIGRWYASTPDQFLVNAFQSYSTDAMAMGITSVQNMATALQPIQMVPIIKKAGLPMRMRVISFPGTLTNSRKQPGNSHYAKTNQLEVTGTKWVLDGTPLERGALMQEAYADRPGWRGSFNFPLETIRKIIRDALASKEQLLLHIVGDSSAGIIMDEMLKIADAATWKKKRVRFEHGDGVRQDLWERARSLGIIVVQNPTHWMFPEIMHQRLGPAEAIQYQPFKSLIGAGIPVALGSDGPNNPYLNIMFATIHANNPAEAISREQAVIAYTSGSAYAEFKEHEKGQLKPGMFADIVVLSQDIFSIPTPALPGTVSLLTIINGAIVHDRLTK